MALVQVAGDLLDATMFVTLEPCAFHQRTPSCAKRSIFTARTAQSRPSVDEAGALRSTRASERWASVGAGACHRSVCL